MEYIRDTNGNLLGTQLTVGNNTYIRDSNGTTLGRYNHSSNITSNHNGQTVANGDHLFGILYKNVNS